MSSSINMGTYVAMRGDVPFWFSPFNNLDAMVLTQLSSIDYSGLLPCSIKVEDIRLRKYKERPFLRDIAALYKHKKKTDNPDEALSSKEKLLIAVGQSRRYERIRMDAFIRDNDELEEKQFSAITFFLSRFHAHIAFRGTDNSFIGWKESYNMLWCFPLPGQKDASIYFEKVQDGFLTTYTMGGHSKGGNLALYAGIHAKEKLQKRIKAIYLYDAPGMIKDLSKNPGYLSIKERIHAFIPACSIFGVLLHTPYEPKIVTSDVNGIYQHALFSWQVGATDFLYCDKRDEFSRKMEVSISKWIEKTPIEQRKSQVDEFFGILYKNNIRQMNQLFHMDIKQIFGLFRSATSLSAENRELLMIILRNFIRR